MGSGQRPQLCTSSVFRTIEALKYMDFMFNVSGDLRSCQQLSCIEDPSISKRNESSVRNSIAMSMRVKKSELIGMYVFVGCKSRLSRQTDDRNNCGWSAIGIPASGLTSGDRQQMPRAWLKLSQLHVTISTHNQQQCHPQRHNIPRLTIKHGRLHKSPPLPMAESQHLQTTHHKMAVLPRPPAARDASTQDPAHI
jgi:hypothetical protein